MSDVVAERRELIEELDDHPLVESIDWTRDGFETVILHLDDTERTGGESDE